MSVKEITKYRSIWMGLAIIWIVLYHFGFNINNSFFSFIKKIGYGGVDIFLFASGLGCYYSLKNDFNIGLFIKKRFFKIMPTYYCFIIIWLILKYFINGLSIEIVVGNLLCIQTFTGLDNSFNWYIDFMWLFYFLSPYFVLIVDKIKSFIELLAVVFIVLLFSIPFFGVEPYIIGVTRLPIFFLGMVFGKMSYMKVILTTKKLVLILLAMIMGLFILFGFYHKFDNLWYYGLHWYPFILITPGLCIIISIFCMKNHSKLMKKLLFIIDKIGNNTLIIYLIHITITSIVEHLISKGFLLNSNKIWLFSIIVVIICCYILKICVSFIKKLIGILYYKFNDYLKVK